MLPNFFFPIAETVFLQAAFNITRTDLKLHRMRRQYFLLSAMMQSHHWCVPHTEEHMPPHHEHLLTIPSRKQTPKYKNRQEVLLQMTWHYRNSCGKIKNTLTHKRQNKSQDRKQPLR